MKRFAIRLGLAVSAALFFCAPAQAREDPLEKRLEDWKVRQAVFKLEPEKEKEARSALDESRKDLGDPQSAAKALDLLRHLGESAIPAVVNYMLRDLDHDNAEDSIMGDYLYNFLRDKAADLWNYECEFMYGMFESREEKMAALEEMKALCIDRGWVWTDPVSGMTLGDLEVARFLLEPDTAGKVKEALSRLQEVFGDKEEENRVFESFPGLGKDLLPGALSFASEALNLETERGVLVGTLLFRYLEERIGEWWAYKPASHFGGFEKAEERRRALLELKVLCLEKGWQLHPLSLKPVEALRDEARAHCGAGRYEKAWEAFTFAALRAPADAGLLNDFAWGLVTFPGKTQDTARRALPYARRAVRLAPKKAGILDTLAEVYFVLGDTKKAVEWNAAARKHSAMFTFFEQLAKYAVRLKEEADAAGASKEERAGARVLLAEGLLGRKTPDTAEAEKLIREALDLDPANGEAPRLLARSYLLQKRYEKAAGAFDLALSRPGAGEDAQLHFGLGASLLEIGGGDKSRSVLHLRKALALDPALPRGRLTLARAYLAAGDADASLAEAQLAEAEIRNRWRPERDREPILILIGKAWEAKGRDAWAMEFFLQSLLSRGNDPEGEQGLERTYRRAFLEGPPPREHFAVRNRVVTPFFDDVTEEAGLGKASGRRVAFGDADGDGKPDLLLNGCFLWLRRGGRYEKGTDAAGLASARGNGGLFGDVDNDGFLDIFVASSARKIGSGDALYLNDGKGVFTKVADAGVADAHPTEGAGFGDFDGDGKLDLYVANYEHPMSVGHPDFLYRGLGDGRFEDVSKEAGIEDKTHRCGRGVNWADFDDDGDMDIHVSNYRLNPNFLWLNRGDGTFYDAAKERGVQGVPIHGYYGHTIGSDFGDIDNDGDLDLFQANLAHPRFIEFSDQSFLLVNGGGPHAGFTDSRRRSGIRFEETHSDPVLADFDNDGFLDLYVTSVYKGRKSFLYRNRGDGTFEDVTWYAGVRADNGWGCSACDVDGDGDLDLLVCAGGRPLLFRNRGNKNGWLAVRVEGGPRSNRAGIGARVWVRYGEGLLQVREVKGGRGTTSQDEICARFGFGDFQGPVDVTVRFIAKPPVTRTWRGVVINRVFTAREKD